MHSPVLCLLISVLMLVLAFVYPASMDGHESDSAGGLGRAVLPLNFDDDPKDSESRSDSPANTQAQTSQEQDQKELALCKKFLPYGNLYSRQELEFRFKRALVRPLDDPMLAFEVLIPRDWAVKPIELSKEEIASDSKTQLPLFAVSPLAKRPEALIQVRYMRLPGHMSVERFLEVYATKLDAEIVCKQHAPLESGQVNDVLLRLNLPELGAALMRISAWRRGDLVLFVAGSCPEKQYEIWKKIFAVSAVSFVPAK